MSNLVSYLPFVKEQQGVHEKLAHRYAGEPWRHDRHIQSASQFANLADSLVAAQRELDAATAGHAAVRPGLAQRLTLTPEDVADLPEELLAELSVSNADKLEFAILNLINEAGGILSLDRILIGLYKATKEIHKRNQLTSKLYRMVQKGMLFAVPTKKGIYSTSEITEGEIDGTTKQATDVQVAIDDVVSQFAPRLTPSDVAAVHDMWEMGRGLPSSVDGRLLAQCRSKIGRDLDRAEAGLARSRLAASLLPSDGAA